MLTTNLELALLAVRLGHARIAKALLTSALGQANAEQPALRSHIMVALNHVRRLPLL